MSKVKVFFGVALALGMMSFSTATAFAEFESNTGKTSGTFKESNFVFSGGGASVSCTSAEGGWKLGALRSHKEIITITIWNTCKAKSSEFKELIPKMKTCEYEMQQKAGDTEPRLTQLSDCTVSTTVLFLTCNIAIPAEGNKELEKVLGENSGKNLLLKAEIKGMTDTTSGTCPGVSGTKEATLKQLFTVEGQKLV